MKNVMSVALLLCVFSVFSEASDKDAANNYFYSANKLYEQGKYEDAAHEYEKVLSAGVQSGNLYYNIGNCYFKAGLLGKAMLNYERARKIIPNDPELKFNYNYTRSLLEDKIVGAKRPFLIRKVLSMAQLLSLSVWLVLAIAGWSLLILFLLIAIFTPALRGKIKIACVLLLAMITISAFFAFVQYKNASEFNAVVIAKEAIVRYGPGEAEVEAFILHEGAKVGVIKNEGEWCQIQIADGKSGWMEKNSVELI